MPRADRTTAGMLAASDDTSEVTRVQPVRSPPSRPSMIWVPMAVNDSASDRPMNTISSGIERNHDRSASPAKVAAAKPAVMRAE